jgi:hypothetical protein
MTKVRLYALGTSTTLESNKSVFALMILLAIVDVPVFLVLGRLTLGADVSDDHGFLVTSAGWRSVLGSTVSQNHVASITWIALPSLGGNEPLEAVCQGFALLPHGFGQAIAKLSEEFLLACHCLYPAIPIYGK